MKWKKLTYFCIVPIQSSISKVQYDSYYYKYYSTYYYKRPVFLQIVNFDIKLRVWRCE